MTERAKVLKLFSVSVLNVSHFVGHASIVAGRHCSIVAAVSRVTTSTTCLLKVKFSAQLELCAA